MNWRRITLGKVAAAWAVLLVLAAIILPPRSASATILTVRLLLIASAVLTVGFVFALIRHFVQAFARAKSVPNPRTYLALITIEAIVAFAGMAFIARVLIGR